MCGLTGFITTGKAAGIGTDRRNYMRQTLIVDSLRGFHGTGIFYGYQNGNGAGYAKSASQGAEFVQAEIYTKAEVDMHKYRYCVGHNRWATTGASDDVNNTHPFFEGDITLVHNGTLDGDGGLITPQLSLKVEVDSHAICHNLAIHDAAEVIGALDGAFCLIWHDKRDNSVNMVRNSERPLWMWKRAHGDTMFFGSEKKMMDWILDRNNVGVGEFEMLPIGKLYKFLPETIVPEITDITLAPVFNYANYYRGGYDQRWQGGYEDGKKRTIYPTKNTGSDSGNSKVATHRGLSKEARGVLETEGLSTIDRLPFVPCVHMHGIVTGTIEHLDMPCFVVGVGAAVSPHFMERRWCIRPIGIRKVPKNGKIETVVIARCVSYYYADSMWEYGNAWIGDMPSEKTGNVVASNDDGDSPPWEIDITACADDDYGIRLMDGPRGERLTYAEWYELTITGCAICKLIPMCEEDSELTWLDDGSGSFLCDDCTEEHIGE
jgi:hypothetical protein